MKYIVYYTDNKLEENLDVAVRANLEYACGGIPIISVSQVPMKFGRNICVGRLPRSYASLHDQLLTGIDAAEEGSIIYMVEHDVFYHPDHFKFEPPDDKIYFNLSRFYFKLGLNSFLKSTGKRAYSQGVARREPLKKYVERKLFQRLRNKACFIRGDFKNFVTRSPNVDIRHGNNFSSENTTKGSWLQGRTCFPGVVTTLHDWGSVYEFQRKTNYRNWKVGTQDYLRERFQNSSEPFYRADLDEMFAELEFKKGAEIGVKVGKHAVSICKANPYLNLMCVDPFDPYNNMHG